MKQIIQQLRSSGPMLIDTPASRLKPGYVLIGNEASVVSAGTERMLVEFAQANLLGKARQQPERVRELLDKVKSSGLLSTLESVKNRLDQPLDLGYSSAGRVIAVGVGVSAIKVGDRVASNGPHAEIVSVPETLCVRVPDSVPAEYAAFATIGAVALEGVRLSAPTLGEKFVVTGLGLVGLLSCQLLRASGCDVIGIDTDNARLEFARNLGIRAIDANEGVLQHMAEYSEGRGVDGVLLTLSSTSSDPIHQAAQMSRRHGRVVLVGVAGLELNRADFYEKELKFQVSCAYGPGRYDPHYERDAMDYPFGEVRWTAGRNMQAVVDMMATGRLDVAALITHRFPFDQAVDAYDVLSSDTSALGIVLQFPSPPDSASTVVRASRVQSVRSQPNARSGPGLAIIGAGNFTSSTLLPALKELEADVDALVGSGGTAAALARRFDIPLLTNDVEEILSSSDVGAVIIATRHESHAELVTQALASGKNVFVEKPLAITTGGLDLVRAAYQERVGQGFEPILGIGFNRRFSPISLRMFELLDSMGTPRAIAMTINAGALPANHWTQSANIGGGRILGEACHFIDLARFFADSPIIEVGSVHLMTAGTDDSAIITLKFENGSVANINYFTNGSPRFPKEQISVFCGGKVMVNDNFRRLSTFGYQNIRTPRLSRQSKGHAEGLAAFLDAVNGSHGYPLKVDEIFEVTEATLLAAQSL